MRLWLLVMLMILPCPWLAGEEVSVAVAVSMKQAMTKLAEQAMGETGDRYTFIFGSSGQLAAQIQSGAPVDLFVSAATKQVDDLVESKFADAASRRVIARNTLVLIAPADAGHPPMTLAALAEPSVRKIAVGEPKSVPAGQYAAQVLQAAKLSDALKERLVYGSNVRQVLDYVERGEVSAGLVYLTDAMQSGSKVQTCLRVDPSLHEPIVYPAIVISAGKHRDGAARLLAFVASEKGQAILASFGFAPATTTPAQNPATAPAQ